VKNVKLPKRLKIGGHDWRIVFPYQFIESDKNYGLCDFGMKTIYISAVDTNGKERPESSVWTSLFHETTHAIDETLSMGVFAGDGEKMETITDELRESRTEAWSEIWFQVLNDNGLLKKPK